MFEIKGQDELTKVSDAIGLIAVEAQRCRSKDAGEGCLKQRTWVLESPLSDSLSVSLTVYSTSIKLSFFIWKNSTHQWFVGFDSMRSCLQTLSGNKGFHISPLVHMYVHHMLVCVGRGQHCREHLPFHQLFHLVKI